MKIKQLKKYGMIISFLAVAALALSGCSGGSDGAAGAAGAAGTTGATGPAGPSGATLTGLSSLTAEQLASLTLSGGVTSVTIASPPVVNFWVEDAAGKGVVGLDAVSGANLANLRFTIAKLVPGENGSPDKWVSYMVTDTSRPTTERVAANLVSHGDGTYTYTFSKDLATVPGVAYEPTLKHRLAIRIASSPIVNPAVIFYDWIPATGATVAAADQRIITTKDACISCHGKLSMHGGGYVDPKMCVLCHTDQRRIGRTEAATDASGNFTDRASGTYLVDSRAVGDFPNLIHKTHMANLLSKANYNYGRVFFDLMGFSMLEDGVRNCRVCHTASDAAPQGDNWKNKPSRLACGACHDGVNFATGAGHGLGGVRTDDSACAICHTASEIERYHLTSNATTNNPSVPTGLVNFTYEISGVTVNGSNQAVIQFQIKKDGTAVTFDGAGSTASSAPAGAVLSGFSGSPSFLLAYADGIDTTVDFNNKGVAAAQPLSVSIAYLLAAGNTRGTITGPVSGVYTATITAAAYNFPVGSKMRTVALQGYFTQVAGTGGIAADAARHTLSVVKTVTGDTARRSVIDPAKCGQCHEWFEGHGGNRNIGKETSSTDTNLCVLCHNPNLSSSGKTVNLAYPEDSNDLKVLIHGIHGTAKRDYPFEFVRIRSGNTYFFTFGYIDSESYDSATDAFTEGNLIGYAGVNPDPTVIHYPGILQNCETCHKAGTYASVPSGALNTTVWTTDGANATTAAVTAARATVPNATDRVTTPFASACLACHFSDAAIAHASANGASVGWVTAGNPTRTPAVRGTANVAADEQCVVCHGSGKAFDVTVVHE